MRLCAVYLFNFEHGDYALRDQARADARKAKNFAEADRIRDDLLDKGIILDDSREGTTWRKA